MKKAFQRMISKIRRNVFKYLTIVMAVLMVCGAGCAVAMNNLELTAGNVLGLAVCAVLCVLWMMYIMKKDRKP